MNVPERSGVLDRISFALLTLSRPAADRWAFVIIFLGGVLNVGLIIGTPLSLAPDEAHYWDWSRHLDLAYYSKGPLVALLIRFSTTLLGDTALGVRGVAALFQALTSILYYVIARRWCQPGIAVILLLAFRSTLMIASIGLVTTTDPVTAFFWLLSLGAALRALCAPRWWALSGLALGFAFLGKYTSAALGASYLFYLLIWGRHQLRTPWPYIGAAFAALSTVPIIVWNSRNGWVNFAHNLGHLTRSSNSATLGDRLGYVGELLAAQLGLYGPVLSVILVVVLVHSISRWPRLNDSARLLIVASVFVLGLCLLVSFQRRVYANWPMPGFLGLFLLLALRLRVADLQLARRVVLATLVNIPLAFLGYAIFAGATFALPTEILPTKKLFGWNQVGQHAEQLASDRSLFTKAPDVMAENYDVLSSLLFEMKSHPRGFCAVVDDRRMNQYDIWSGWQGAKGNSMLVVLKEPSNRAKVASTFERLEPLPPYEGFAIKWGNEELRRFYFYRGEDFRGEAPVRPSRR